MLQQSFNNIGMFQQYYKYCVTILYLYVPTILQHSNNIVAALQCCSSNFRVTLQCYIDTYTLIKLLRFVIFV